MISKLFTRALLKIIANSLAVIVVSFSVIKIEGFDAIIMTILLLTIVNSFIKPFVRLLTLPLKILTLGLLTFVINLGLLLLGVAINTGLFYLVKHIYPDNITISSLIAAIKGGIILSVINWILGLFSK